MASITVKCACVFTLSNSRIRDVSGATAFLEVLNPRRHDGPLPRLRQQDRQRRDEYVNPLVSCTMRPEGTSDEEIRPNHRSVSVG